jgi:hypothetical protein
MAPEIELNPQLDAQAAARPGGGQQMTLPIVGEDAGAGEQAPAARRLCSGSAPIWLQRLSLFVLVLFCVYLGVLVMVLPWWRRVWDDNLWIQSRPALASILHTGAVRGVISGLGLLDIWIGISEAVHYRDHRG